MILEDLYPGAGIKTAFNGKEAIKILNENPTFSAILCDFNMPDTLGDEVFLTNAKNKNWPFIFITSEDITTKPTLQNFKKSNPLNHHLEKPFSAETLGTCLEKILHSQSADKLSNPKINQGKSEIKPFKKLSIDRFMHFKKFNFAVYIKMSEEKFIKLAHQGDLPDFEQIKRLQEKGVDSLYFAEADFNQLIMQVCTTHKKLLKSQNNPETIITVASSIYDFVKEVGLTPELSSLMEDITDSMLLPHQANQSLLSRLSMMLKNDNPCSRHAMLTSTLINATLNEHMENYTRFITKKVIHASLFANISLNRPEDVFFDDPSDPKFLFLAKDIQNEIINHPIESAKLYEDFTDADNDTHKLILMHHERPGGLGFPKKTDTDQFNPLNIYFNIGSQLALEFLRFNQDFISPAEVKKMFQTIAFKFPGKKFEKVMTQFQATLKL
jgi:response regulator RpfG family c-di-GMP phosphodiesterase